jgi:predicted transcriptional regulator
MRKVQVFLREDQTAALSALARQSGRPRAELVRQGIDLLLQRSDVAPADWRERVRAAAGLWRDHDQIEAEMNARRETRPYAS